MLILIIVFASLGIYYSYLNKQKDAMLAKEPVKDGEYRLYTVEPDAPWSWGEPYYLDAAGDTTGHSISKETYEAIMFLRNKENGKVLSWWDFELEIKAAGKEPVISYASEAIKPTIARPASLYGANLVYMPKERMRGIFSVIVMASNPDINFQSLSDMGSSEVFEKRFYEPSMTYKFNTGAELKYFGKVFENEDVIIYELK